MLPESCSGELSEMVGYKTMTGPLDVIIIPLSASRILNRESPIVTDPFNLLIHLGVGTSTISLSSKV